MKKILCLLIAVVMAMLCFVACNSNTTVKETSETEPDYVKDVEALPVHVSDDKYRNYYHIWVCAFEDSDGDETGDLQGIINKLDYINDGDAWFYDADGMLVAKIATGLNPVKAVVVE